MLLPMNLWRPYLVSFQYAQGFVQQRTDEFASERVSNPSTTHGLASVQ